MKAVIIDDEQYSCDRLKKLLASFEFIKETVCCTSSGEGFKAVAELKPEIIFLDVELENSISGFELLERIDSGIYQPYVIMVTGHTQYSIKAIRHRVFDYIVKPVDIDELKTSVDRLQQHIATRGIKLNSEFDCLSEREREVLKLVLEGLNSKEIAERLFISLFTVNTHRRNILRKTGIRSVLDLYKIHTGCNA